RRRRRRPSSRSSCAIVGNNPRMERLLVAAIAIAALLLRLAGMDHDGWGAEYYSAAAVSMTASASNFLFAAFDPAGFISVDQPPVALWVQAASVAIFGAKPWAVLVPQAIEGTACVALMHFLVRRRFGVAAGSIAASLLAITPVLVAANRT